MTSYLGTVQIFAFSLTPRGWARCNGQIVPICPSSEILRQEAS